MMRRVCCLHSLVEIVLEHLSFVVELTCFLLLECATRALRNVGLADVGCIRLHKLHRVLFFVAVLIVATQRYGLAVVVLGSLV